MRLHTILAALAALLVAGTSSAEGVAIDPGQWEMTSTMTMSMMPQPRTTTTMECIEEDELNPEDFNMDEENPCAIKDVKVDGNTAHWTISCPAGNGMVMDGQWEVTSHGNKLSGSGSMETEMAGQKMSIEMSWEGKRIGDC